MLQLQKQMTKLISRLSFDIQKELLEELCLSADENETSVAEKIAETLLKSDLKEHFDNDCSDLSGLSFTSTAAGILCDRPEDEWGICMPIVLLWVNKRVLSDKELDLIENMVANYDKYYSSAPADAYRKDLRNEYVADCADDSPFMNFMKLILAVLYEKETILQFLYDAMQYEEDEDDKASYADVIKLIKQEE